MKCWDWEFFDTFIAADMFTISECGSLFGPVTDFKVERDDELNLILETTSASDSTSNAIERAAGSVYQAEAQVKFKGIDGYQAVAAGVIPLGHKKTWGARSEQDVTKERSLIRSLQFTQGNAQEPVYIIDWVGNMDTFIWPDSDDRVESGQKRRILKSPIREITMSIPIDSRGHGRTCVHLIVEGVEFFVGQSKAKPDHVEKPGFILYIGTPNEDTRAKIRDCLSFCLGIYLLYLGDTKFDSEWFPVAFDARSGHALVKEASRLVGWQPSPLGLTYEKELSSELLGRMMSSLYNIYDEYGLQSSFWSYWHAIAAPVHMQAVHFGAAIESLQNKFLKRSSEVQGSFIIKNEQHWENLCEQISTLIAGADLDEEEKTLLIKKAKGLNRAPQSVLIQRFFDGLRLEFDKLENAVWGNRNRAAHGGSAKADNAHRLIRENKVLLLMLNRILLALGGGADNYHDYYTLGRPVRSLAESIPDDRMGTAKVSA